MVLIHPTLDLASQTLSVHIPAHQDFPASSHTIPLTPPTSASAESDFLIWGGTHKGTAVGTPELLEALSNFMGKKVLLIQKGNTRREGGYDAGWVETLGIELDYDEGAAIKWNDAFPILLCSESSLAEIGNKVASDARVDKQRWNDEGIKNFEIERFRGNIVVKGAEAWSEDSWSEITIGEGQGELVVAARCARCMVSLCLRSFRLVDGKTTTFRLISDLMTALFSSSPTSIQLQESEIKSSLIQSSDHT